MDPPTWIIGKWLRATLLLGLVTALGNYLYVLYLFGEAPSISCLDIMHLYTTSIAVFPVTAIGYTRVIKPTQSNELVAGSLIENIAVEKPTKSSSPSDKQILGVSASSIFFV